MSVSNGQKGNEANFNAAFVSKIDDTGNDVTGKINLKNVDTASGDNVLNIQKRLNNNSLKIPSTKLITAGGSITLNSTTGNWVIKVSGDGAAVSLSTTPFGSSGNWPDGTEVTLVGTDASNTVTVGYSDTAKGAVVNGDASLKKYYSITLIWDSSLDRWLEKSRNFA